MGTRRTPRTRCPGGRPDDAGGSRRRAWRGAGGAEAGARVDSGTRCRVQEVNETPRRDSRNARRSISISAQSFAAGGRRRSSPVSSRSDWDRTASPAPPALPPQCTMRATRARAGCPGRARRPRAPPGRARSAPRAFARAAPRPRPPRPDRPRAPGPPPRPRRADASRARRTTPPPRFRRGRTSRRGGRGPVPRRRGESAGRPRDLVSGRRVGRRRRVVGRRAAGGGGCRASNSRRTGTLAAAAPALEAPLPSEEEEEAPRNPSGTLPFHPDSVVSALPGAVGSATAVSPRRRLKRRDRRRCAAAFVPRVGALRDANRARVPPLVGPFRPRVPENPLRGRFGRRRGASGPRRG